MLLMATHEIEGKESLKERIVQYFRELGIEWKKITFPEHKPIPFKRGWGKAELWRATITVFVFTALFAVILSVLDWAMTHVFRAIFY